MRKRILNNRIYYYDEKNFELMYFDFFGDECVWHFDSDSVITLTPDMEMYSPLNDLMDQEYEFEEGILRDYKDNNKLVWYSDGYYNPDDQWSVDSVSCLNIERKDGLIYIWCTKKIDEKLNRLFKYFDIVFSPLGNGKYAKNLKNGLTLQDDFVILVYQKLLVENKQRVRNID